MQSAEVLFPEPLHLLREVDDPISGRVTTIHEYCEGNRVAVIGEDHVTLTDYTKQEVLEVDRSAGTYSVASFDEIARAHAVLAPRRAAPAWRLASNVTSPRSDRNPALDLFRLESETGSIEVAVDRSITLSRGALDVLLGGAYPNAARPEHELIANAARHHASRLQPAANGAAREMHALPVEQKVSFDAGHETMTLRNLVVRVTRDRIPADALVIPPGSRRVEANVIRLARELPLLDRVAVPVR